MFRVGNLERQSATDVRCVRIILGVLRVPPKLNVVP